MPGTFSSWNSNVQSYLWPRSKLLKVLFEPKWIIQHRFQRTTSVPRRERCQPPASSKLPLSHKLLLNMDEVQHGPCPLGSVNVKMTFRKWSCLRKGGKSGWLWDNVYNDRGLEVSCSICERPSLSWMCGDVLLSVLWNYFAIMPINTFCSVKYFKMF